MSFNTKAAKVLLIFVLVVLMVGVGTAGYIFRQQPVVPAVIVPTKPMNVLPSASTEKSYSVDGLTLQYPSSFKETKSESTAYFNNSQGNFSVLAEKDPQNRDTNTLKADFYKNDDYGYQYEDSFITIAGAPAYKQGRYDLGVIEKYRIPKNGIVYTIGFEFNFDPKNQLMINDTKALIQSILSTVSLKQGIATPPVSQADIVVPGTENWKTYNNDKYGFEIKYPSGYSIFSGVNQEMRKTIPADPQSTKIIITEKPDLFFDSEPTYLSVELLGTYVTDFEKWINDSHVITAQNDYRVTQKGATIIAGEQAYQLKAECGLDSPGNIVLVNHASKTYLVKYDSENCFPLSEKILSTFKFVK